MYFLIVYAIAGTLITTVVFGRVLIGLNFFQLKREADFRFSLVRIRENAESIALYRGEDQELSQVKRLFDAALLNIFKLIKMAVRPQSLSVWIQLSDHCHPQRHHCVTRHYPASLRWDGRSRRRAPLPPS